MSAHTPAPWVVKPGLSASNVRIDSKGSKAVIPLAWVANLNDGKANAALIAAAPELLAAAAIARSWLQAAIDDGEHADRARADLRLVDSIIAKATGQ